MRIAFYSRTFSSTTTDHFKGVFHMLAEQDASILLSENTAAALHELGALPEKHQTFSGSEDLGQVDLLVSIGGDGTMLDTVQLTAEKGIPVLGVNTGRLGFLSGTQVEDAEAAVNAFLEEKYELEERSLLSLSSPEGLLEGAQVALNDVAIHKRDTSSMIIIHAYLDGEFLNTYWADGLIIATPTGSTAYSLSCGGPIIDPRSKSFIITPIAPHNLNVRPFVVRDNGEITLKVDGRDASYLLSLDSRSMDLDKKVELRLSRNSSNMKLVTFKDQDFLHTLRHKLSWGLDRRN